MATTDVRTLTQRDLNRALLARQLLLERATTPIPKALDRVGGIQAQYAPSMYIGLWSRLAGFEREQLTRALERGSVIQGTLMRATIHLVSKGDYWPFAAGIRKDQREWRLRVYGRGLDTRELIADARKVRRAMRGQALRRGELEEVLGKRLGLCGLALDLVRVPPSGTWERRRADIYALAEDWVGPQNATAAQGVDLLVRRYLQGFGPAPAKDIAGWAGVNVATIRPALDRLSLRRFRDELGKELLDLPRAALPDPETPAPPRFLPVWDATLLVHARRTGILPEEYRPRIFNVKNAQSVNTFLVDGQVAGTWRHEQGRIELKPFGRLDRTTRADVEEEADRLAAFHV
jgi:hypothetical protein